MDGERDGGGRCAGVGGDADSARDPPLTSLGRTGEALADRERLLERLCDLGLCDRERLRDREGERPRERERDELFERDRLLDLWMRKEHVFTSIVKGFANDRIDK